MRPTILAWLACSLPWLAPASAGAAEAGDVTIPLSLGTNVYTHRFASAGTPAADRTIADQFALSEFPGAGVFVTNQLRVGLNLQFTEAITHPPSQSAFTTFALLPQINWSFWGPLTVSLVPSFFLRLNAVDRFGFAVQGVLTAAVPLGGGFSATASVEVPVFFTPMTSIGITPLLGLVYRL